MRGMFLCIRKFASEKMMEKDIEKLRNGISKKVLLAVNICLPFMILVFIIAGIIFAIYSKKAASMDGIPLSSVLSKIDLEQDYSGLYVFARECLVKAIIYFSLALAFSISWVGKCVQMGRDKRILKYIEEGNK